MTRTVTAAAGVSFAGAVAFLVLLTALHFLKPEIDPSWRFISEYSIGDYGWLMVLAFLSLALSCVALVAAIWQDARTIGGRIGLILLLITAVGFLIAAIFTSDPLTATEDARTTHGKLHELGATLDLLPFAAVLVSWSMGRRNPAWYSAKRLLLWTTVLVWIGAAVFIVSLVMMFPADGKFGPDVALGWQSRFTILAHCVWLMTVAWFAIRLRRQRI